MVAWSRNHYVLFLNINDQHSTDLLKSVVQLFPSICSSYSFAIIHCMYIKLSSPDSVFDTTALLFWLTCSPLYSSYLAFLFFWTWFKFCHAFTKSVESTKHIGRISCVICKTVDRIVSSIKLLNGMLWSTLFRYPARISVRRSAFNQNLRPLRGANNARK